LAQSIISKLFILFVGTSFQGNMSSVCAHDY
jgi:hypothetical protein